MSSPDDETPGQKAARERRERREAKIKAGGSSRLDKITQLSGRTPEIVRNASPSPARPAAPSPSQSASSTPPFALPPSTESSHPNVQAQQEAFLRNMMRQQQPSEPQEQTPEDPLARLMAQFAGVAPASDPNDPNAPPPGGLPISGADLAAATGLPPFVANLLTGQTSTTAVAPESPKWKVVHTLFSIAIGIYLVMVINTSITTYGKKKPPPPAVAQSPFVIFLAGEVALQGARVALKQGRGGLVGKVMKIFKDFIRDGAVVIFLLGVSEWWNGGTV